MESSLCAVNNFCYNFAGRRVGGQRSAPSDAVSINIVAAIITLLKYNVYDIIMSLYVKY